MKLFPILLLLFALQITQAQNQSEDFLGSWYSYGSEHRLSKTFSITPYGELRFYEASSNYNLAYASLSGNYHLNSNSTLGLGYAFLDIDTVFEFDNVPNVLEHRIFEQYAYKHNVGRLKLLHRGRLEHRFLELVNGNELQNRFRYKFNLQYDLNKTFFLSLYDEPFINFQDQVFSENRFYAGLGINILKNSQIQIGYLKQLISKNKLNRIHIGINFKTDYRAPKTTVAHL